MNEALKEFVENDEGFSQSSEQKNARVKQEWTTNSFFELNRFAVDGLVRAMILETSEQALNVSLEPYLCHFVE